MNREQLLHRQASDVAVGDYVWPDAWYGGGTVTESRPSSGDLWKLTYDAPVVNPPAIWYGRPDALVPVRGEGC